MANCQTELVGYILAQSKLLKSFKALCYIMIVAETVLVGWILHYKYRGQLRLNWFTQTMMVLLMTSSVLQFVFNCIAIRTINPNSISGYPTQINFAQTVLISDCGLGLRLDALVGVLLLWTASVVLCIKYSMIAKKVAIAITEQNVVKRSNY